MKSHSAQDFYYSIFPLLYVSRIFGLTSFSMKGHDGSRRPALSCSSRIFSFSLIAVSFCGHLLILWMRGMVNHVFSHEMFITKTLELYQFIFACISFISMVVFASTNSLQLKLLVDVAQLDAALGENIYLTEDIHRVCRNVSVFLIFCHAFWLLENSLSLFLTPLHLLDVLNTLFNIWNGVVFSVTDMHLIYYGLCLKHRFSSCNQFISKHIHKTWIKSVCNNTKRFENRCKLRDLKTLEEANCRMTDICESFNSAFGVQILCCVFFKFVIVLFDTLYLAQIMIGSGKFRYGVTWNSLLLLEMGATVCSFVFISWICSYFSEEVSLHHQQDMFRKWCYIPTSQLVGRKLSNWIIFNYEEWDRRHVCQKLSEIREESDTYLTHVCTHRWSRESPLKIEWTYGSFSQPWGFHLL